MDSKSKTKAKEVLSPDQDVLGEDLLLNLTRWLRAIPVLTSKLAPFAPVEKEIFFAQLLIRGGEPVLSLFEALAGQDEALDIAMVRGIARWNSPRAGEFLTRRAARTSSKKLGKEIRRAIFRLKSRGLAVEETADLSPGIFRLPQAARAEGYVSAIDPTGSRLVWVARAQLSHGMAVISSVLSDTEGVIDLQVFESSRKKFHEYLDQMRKDFAWEIVEVEPEYCAGLIHEADEMQRKKGKTSHPEYLKFRTLAGPAPDLPLRPFIYRYLAEEDIKNQPELLDRSPSLFQTPFFQTWYLEKGEVQKYMTLLEEAASSRIILAPHQKEGRYFDIYRQAVHELFPIERRQRLRRRLEEMAYLLWQKDQKAEAKIGLAAAAGLSEKSKVLSPHPFLLELVKRTLIVLGQEVQKEKEKEKGAGLIIAP